MQRLQLILLFCFIISASCIISEDNAALVQVTETPQNIVVEVKESDRQGMLDKFQKAFEDLKANVKALFAPAPASEEIKA